MAEAVVVGRGPRWFLVTAAAVRPIGDVGAGRVGALTDPALDALRRFSRDEELTAESDPLAAELRDRLGRTVGTASLKARRTARSRLPAPEAPAERAYLLGLAHRRLEEALRAPEEILITLAREEERLERALGREERAAEAFLALEGSPLAAYRDAWATVREGLARHHRELATSVESLVGTVAPNLTAVVGGRAAARLLSAAGGLSQLARYRAARLQLLGTRRRPSAEHGPRYGILYRAARMSDVPPARRGAYARSLAALAAVAARADATTRRDLSSLLVARRDRRVEQLRRRAG